jgi:cytochrome c oxidase cbb3-type subunit 3
MSVDRSSLRLVPAVAVAVSLAGALGAFNAQTAPSQGDAAAGKKIYAIKCVACHKLDGSGGVKVTGNPTPDFRDPKRMADPKFDDDYLRDCITNGKPKSGMVAWSKQGVKPLDIENLIAYIRTLVKKT